MYLAVPVTLYACERLTRALREQNCRVTIIKVRNFFVQALHLSLKDSIHYCAQIENKQSMNLLFVMQASIYPGNVLSIQMKKPPGFKYKSGMYLFVKCPDVSPFEW